jgi:carboxyl-terminal processing protease
MDEDEMAAFRQRMQTDAVLGLTGGLDDAYTTFLLPSEAAPVAAQMAGEYEGIGVWVEAPNGRLTVVAPMPGSPADRAGMMAGDVLIAADGVSLEGMGQEQALALVRGPVGSFVEITFQRSGIVEPLSMKIKRAEIQTPAVSYTLLPDAVALIQVSIFGDQTTDELDSALLRAVDDGARGIVLDLRNNGGGWLTSAQEMIGRFVPADSGGALYEELGPADHESLPLPILEGDNHAVDLPMVVLVNGGTASAAEIVAGALQYYDRATLVGEQTFGKGSVQRVHDFEDGSSARITFAHWLTPGQEPIEGIGIRPDVVVVGARDGEPEQDLSLLRALDVLARSQSLAPTPED